MKPAKWLMKQYWRVGTIRAVSGLGLGMFVLGNFYYSYVPWLEGLGILGALILGALLVLLFLGIGWAYDEKGKMWSQKIQTSTERNPYQYVADFKSKATEYPVIYAVVETLRSIVQKVGISSDSLDELSIHMRDYFSGRENRKDIDSSISNAEVYMADHPFNDDPADIRGTTSIDSRIKLGFETNMLRLMWIQALTGLVQESLVVGALYATLLFPEAVVDGVLPFEYLLIGIFGISLPLYIVLTILGWYYDSKLKMWSPDMIVKVERNPYTFLAQPRDNMITLPFFVSLFNMMDDMFGKLEIDNSELQEVLKYLDTFSQLEVSDSENMKRARKLRAEYGSVFKKSTQGENH